VAVAGPVVPPPLADTAPKISIKPPVETPSAFSVPPPLPPAPPPPALAKAPVPPPVADAAPKIVIKPREAGAPPLQVPPPVGDLPGTVPVPVFVGAPVSRSPLPPVVAPPPTIPPRVPGMIPAAPKIMVAPKPAALPGAKVPAVAEIPPVQRRGFKIGVFLAFALIGLLLVGGFILVWKSLNTPPAPVVAPVAHPTPAPVTPVPPVPPPAPAAAPAPAPAPVAVVPPAAQPPPPSVIDRAQQALAERRAVEQNRVDNLAEGEEPPPQRLIPPPPVAAPVPPSQTAQVPRNTTLSPGVMATTNEEVTVQAQASKEFKRFVAEARISGVFQGDPPRVFINGRTVRAGDMVDKNLGVTFESIDVNRKTITFRDESGATVTRRY